MKKILAIIIVAVIMSAPKAYAAFTITSPDSTTFSSRTVSITEQNTSANFSITVNDDRGGSPGWSVTMKSSHITIIGPVTKLAGNNNTVTSSGSYDGTLGVTAPVSKYILTITIEGAVGTAKFDVSGAEIQTNVTTGSLVSIGTKGVRADFDVATYQVNDQWQILVDTFPYTGMTVTPGTITANSGSLNGVSAGSQSTLSGSGAESNTIVLMSATVGNGTGNYTQSIDVVHTLHNNSLSGNYSGVFTFTLA